MNTLVKRQRGYRLNTDERMKLVEQITDAMENGVFSELGLAKELNVNTTTIKRYKPYAEHIYDRVGIDRTKVRNLQIARVYRLIEQLTMELNQCKNLRDKILIYNQIYKQNNHLATITGISTDNSVETIQPTELVIIRSTNTDKETV